VPSGPHAPLQQLTPSVQGSPFGRHAWAHVPPWHARAGNASQQSADVPQRAPAGEHAQALEAPPVYGSGAQRAEQQWASFVQVPPAGTHADGSPELPVQAASAAATSAAASVEVGRIGSPPARSIGGRGCDER
jgi:hypothetical protein